MSLTAIRKSIASIFLTLAFALCAMAQDKPAPPADQQKSTEPPPAAGGPQTETGPYAIPKKKEEPPPPPPERPKKIENMPDYSLHVDVPLVNVDVMVMTQQGQFIPGLKQENFRVYEDGVEQKVTNFNRTDAPITAVLLLEFANTNYYFLNEMLTGAYTFTETLKKDDWVAVISYDMKPTILADFTQDKKAVVGAINQLRIPGFSETNLFDALNDTLDRMDRVEGHKYVILISTGVDTFSKLTLDKILKKIKTTHDITIFPVSIGWQIREYYEAHGGSAPHGMGIPVGHMDYLQADNEMKTFASLTGGRAFFPRFEAEFPEIFHDIGSDIRNQYSLAYHPTNTKMDGTYRKLKVAVLGPDGSPLKIKDQHGKDVKYQVIAREGYTAKHTVE